MSQEPIQAQPAAQAGPSGEAARVGPEVGGVHSSDELSWLDLWALAPETRASLKATAQRNAACPQALPRSKGAGDGSQEIRTPHKLRKLQRALYCKAKAQPAYRFWSLYSELTRLDLLEYALQWVESNGGAAGVDGQTIESITAKPEIRQQWLEQLQRELQTKSYRPSPVRRVYIPKPDGGQRPPGIPTVKDRVVQMAALLMLAPIFDADYHPHSYGFRPHRRAHQALDAIIQALRQGKLEVVDADLSKYFDHISHSWMGKNIPMDKTVLHKWLKAGYVEKRILFPTEAGTPQGGVASPTLANMTLDGLERLLAKHFPREKWKDGKKWTPKVNLVRYADDFIITGDSRELLENEVRPLVEQFWRERGLTSTLRRRRRSTG
jgi:RNA-directed DNA polymerase